MTVQLLAAIEPSTWYAIIGVGLATLSMVYFGVRYWLGTTRPPAMQDVHTPNVDRLNKRALEHMAEETAEEDEAETRALEDEDSPEDLKAIVPEDPEAPLADAVKK